MLRLVLLRLVIRATSHVHPLHLPDPASFSPRAPPAVRNPSSAAAAASKSTDNILAAARTCLLAFSPLAVARSSSSGSVRIAVPAIVFPVPHWSMVTPPPGPPTVLRVFFLAQRLCAASLITKGMLRLCPDGGGDIGWKGGRGLRESTGWRLRGMLRVAALVGRKCAGYRRRGYVFRVLVAPLAARASNPTALGLRRLLIRQTEGES